MTKKEIGDMSVLAAIKEQLELGIEDCINIKVTISVGNMAGKIDSFIPKKKWEEYLTKIVTEVETTMENLEVSLDDVGDADAYMCLEGYWHDCDTPEQAFIGNMLVNSCITMSSILYECDGLKHLLAATKTHFIINASESEEYKALCNIKDLPLEMCGYHLDDREDDPDARVLVIADDFPYNLLDEIYAKLKEKTK